MPVKPLHITAMDIVRARDIVQSLTPLKGLSGEDAELVAKTIAQCFAKGREQALRQVKDELNNSAIAPQLEYWLGSTSKEDESA